MVILERVRCSWGEVGTRLSICEASPHIGMGTDQPLRARYLGTPPPNVPALQGPTVEVRGQKTEWEEKSEEHGLLPQVMEHLGPLKMSHIYYLTFSSSHVKPNKKKQGKLILMLYFISPNRPKIPFKQVIDIKTEKF